MSSSTAAIATVSMPWTTMVRSSQKMVRVVIPLGCMSSVAVASPILFEYRKLWLVTILIFFLSTGIFVVQYPEEMKAYGPFTLALAIFLGFASYSSARTSLPELIPWIPMIVWLFVSLTVYFLPRTHNLLYGPVNLQDAAERGRNYHFQRFPIEHTGQSVPSNSPGSENLELADWLRGMDRRSMLGLPDNFSTHGSDINLHEHPEAMRVAMERVMSFAQTGFFTNGLSQSSSEEPHHNLAGVHNGHLEDPVDGFNPRSTVGSASATSDEYMTPLLG